MARWQDYVLRDTRANQPSGPLVTTGTLYSVTDENDIIERWSGSAWEAYSPGASLGGDVVGPASAVNNDIAVFNGTSGKLIKDGGFTIAGVVAAAVTAAQAAIIPINLATQVTGDLPYANFTAFTAASRLLGRGDSGAGDAQEISLGSNLSMTGTVLSASGGSSGGVTRSANGFRLTLASGFPVFAPQQATPSATDTVNEIVTFTVDPGWVNGTILTPDATAGGLTTGTTYYMHRITATTYSFHTTVAAAMSGASRVNLTATIGLLKPTGISTTGIYLTPMTSSQIALYDGYDWAYVDLAELSVGLGTLSANTNYDLFVDYNGGVPVLSIGAAWTSDILRSVALTRQDGVWVSSADAQSRYVGTFRTDTTTTTIDNGGGVGNTGGRRYLWNMANRVRGKAVIKETTSTWAAGTGGWRAANNSTANRIEFVRGMAEDIITGLAHGIGRAAGVQDMAAGIALDSITVSDSDWTYATTAANSSIRVGLEGNYANSPAIGYHFLQWMEYATSNTITWSGTEAAPSFEQAGMACEVTY